MAPAIVWRWMKRALCGGAEQSLGVIAADLDEIAEDIVVLDLQPADIGLGGVVALQAGDDPPAVVAQLPRLVEIGPAAVADEAAVALQMRQVVGERGAERIGERGRSGAQGRNRARDFVGEFVDGEATGDAGGNIEPVANGGEIARPAAVEGQARQ